MRLDIYILDTRLDTYKDDIIELKSSIVDSQDPQKITTEFTRTFTLPASKRNSKFFKHYYDADIDNTFDARTKKSGRIVLNGLPYKYGKYRLLKVESKLNKPSSYTVSFVGNLVDIKKELRKDKLEDLDLSAYDHDFNATNVKTGLQSSLFGGDLIYSLNPKRQYFYSSDPTDITDTETLTNIGWNETNQVHGVRFTELSPSIKAIKILEAIETAYPKLSFSRDFFGGATFNTLFMSMVNKEGSIGGNSQIIDWDGGDTTYMNLTTDEGTFPTNASPSSGDNFWFVLKCAVFPAPAFDTLSYDIVLYVDGEEQERETFTGYGVLRSELESDGTGEIIYTAQWRIETSETITYSANLNQRLQTNLTTPFQENTTASANTITSNFIASQNLPDIEILDWLVSIFKAYKLVAIPQPDGTIYVQTLEAYYQSGTLWDVTPYVDWEKSFAERGKIFSEINFNFQDPSTIIAQQFEKNTGTPYGNESAKFSEDSADPNAELLDGDTYDIELDFETVMYDRLIDVFTGNTTRVMYAPLINESLSPAVPEPFFHYKTLQGISGDPIKFIGDNSGIEKLTGGINTVHHSQFISGSGQTFLFSTEYSEWSGNLMEQTLYRYHEPYLLSLFNIKRRDFIFKIKLPFFIISRLGLNDVFKIKGRYYRIDNFTLNLTEGDGNFTLINSFDNDLTGLTVGASAYNIDADGGVIVIIVSGDSISYTLIDSGFGTSWVTVDTSERGHVNITVAENDTFLNRNIYIDILKPNSSKKTSRIYINQRGRGQDDFVTFDETDVTFDNTLLTWDNQ